LIINSPSVGVTSTQFVYARHPANPVPLHWLATTPLRKFVEMGRFKQTGATKSGFARIVRGEAVRAIGADQSLRPKFAFSTAAVSRYGSMPIIGQREIGLRRIISMVVEKTMVSGQGRTNRGCRGLVSRTSADHL